MPRRYTPFTAQVHRFFRAGTPPYRRGTPFLPRKYTPRQDVEKPISKGCTPTDGRKAQDYIPRRYTPVSAQVHPPPTRLLERLSYSRAHVNDGSARNLRGRAPTPGLSVSKALFAIVGRDRGSLFDHYGPIRVAPARLSFSYICHKNSFQVPAAARILGPGESSSWPMSPGGGESHLILGEPPLFLFCIMS